MAQTPDIDALHPATAGRVALDDALHAFVEGAADRLWTLAEPDLLSLRRDLEATASRLAAVTLAVTREIDQRGAAMSVGASSTVAWLTGSLRMSPGAARREALLASAVSGELAATGAALADGRLSEAAASEIDRAVRALPPTVELEIREQGEAFLLEQAAHLRPDQIQRLGRHLLHAVDPDHGDRLADRELDAVAARELFVARGGPGRLGQIRGALDAEATEALLAALGPLAAPRPAEDGAPDPRTAARRRADALLELVEIALASGDLPTEGGEPPHVLVTVPLATLQSGAPPREGSASRQGLPPHQGRTDDPPAGAIGDMSAERLRAAELPDGTPLSAESARRVACDADLVAVLLGRFGEVLDLGRTTRSVPRRLRKALVARDRGCAFPGCDRPQTWCHAHHIWHWAHGGPTDLDNLVLLCAHHHRIVHHAGWQVAIGENRLPHFVPPRWVDPLQVPITRPWRRALDHLPLRT